jgi:hypothetical protein
MEVIMPKYYCPLCNQPVSKTLYDKITGIWKEREKKLASLRAREKALLKKEKEMRTKFRKDRARLESKYASKMKEQLAKQERNFRVQIKKEKQRVKEEKAKIEEQFQKKITATTEKIIQAERNKQKKNEKVLKQKFEKVADEKFAKERDKLRKRRTKFGRQQRLQKNRNERLLRQYKSLQAKSEVQLEKASKKIESLEEQLRKEQTSQVLGLLEEKAFLAQLGEGFPNDRYIHTGKGGDITHYVYDRDKKVGTIVYELKKVAKFNRKHILQTFNAKNKRDADYGILVTNARRSKKDSGFSISHGVIIIHPAGALVLIKILRDHLIQIAKLRLTKQERNRTIKAVLEYIRSANFRNSVETIIKDTLDLYKGLQKEVKDHVKHWEFRIDRYRDMNSKAHTIENKVVHLLLLKDRRKKLPKPAAIQSIELPKKIE